MTHIVYDIAYDITPTMSYTMSYTIFTYTMYHDVRYSILTYDTHTHTPSSFIHFVRRQVFCFVVGQATGTMGFAGGVVSPQQFLRNWSPPVQWERSA
jgi:hypothetical protein